MTEQETPHRRSTDVRSHKLGLGVRVAIWVGLSGTIVYMGTMIGEEQKKVRTANERLFRIFHGEPKAIVMCDEKGVVVEYNKAAEEMFGWTRDEVMSRDVSILIPERLRREHKAHFHDAVAALKAADEDWRIVRTGMRGAALTKEGKEYPIEFSTRGIRYGDSIEFMAVFSKDGGDVPKTLQGPLELPKKIIP